MIFVDVYNFDSTDANTMMKQAMTALVAYICQANY
jgi:hypothetical protein